MQLNLPLEPNEILKFDAIKTMLEAEREIKPSDLDLIALLVINMTMIEKALDDLRVNGVTITSTTAHGIVVKNNPANEVFSKANVAVRACMEQLLMTPKSKAVLMKNVVEKKEEQEDPLLALIKERNKE
ncbi:P27 family phage terminase small subunit [Vibrio parahaemolyticus]|nr:P27 family phage terminase small subunit [Vibrio parahaemolyticus]EHU0344303.1 P27 family phage terminase small subunit [Vibrio parahaemolyticus]EHU0354337.1 P27 family phage terminase small subunit [Vibrio parahaemolyticus]